MKIVVITLRVMGCIALFAIKTTFGLQEQRITRRVMTTLPAFYPKAGIDFLQPLAV